MHLKKFNELPLKRLLQFENFDEFNSLKKLTLLFKSFNSKFISDKLKVAIVLFNEKSFII